MSVKVTLEGMLAASEAIKAIPPGPFRLRMNATTLAYCREALPKPKGARVFPILEGLPVHADDGLATGIVEVDWSDGRIESIDLLVRNV